MKIHLIGYVKVIEATFNKVSDGLLIVFIDLIKILNKELLKLLSRIPLSEFGLKVCLQLNFKSFKLKLLMIVKHTSVTP